jgi:hypothetical protein
MLFRNGRLTLSPAALLEHRLAKSESLLLPYSNFLE